MISLPEIAVIWLVYIGDELILNVLIAKIFDEILMRYWKNYLKLFGHPLQSAFILRVSDDKMF